MPHLFHHLYLFICLYVLFLSDDEQSFILHYIMCMKLFIYIRAIRNTKVIVNVRPSFTHCVHH